MRANDRQVGGDHYKRGTSNGIEAWDVIAMFGTDFFRGNAFKYLLRWRSKGGVQDLQKALHYLDKFDELQAQGKLPSAMVIDTDKVWVVMKQVAETYGLAVKEHMAAIDILCSRTVNARQAIESLIEGEVK